MHYEIIDSLNAIRIINIYKHILVNSFKFKNKSLGICRLNSEVKLTVINELFEFLWINSITTQSNHFINQTRN